MYIASFCKRIFSALLSLTIFILGLGIFAQAEKPEAQRVRKNDLAISELMVKNHATRLNAAGDVCDYIEIVNLSNKAIQMEGFGLSDDKSKVTWTFPELELLPGEYLVVLAAKNENAERLSCGFSLSLDETVYLTDRSGRILDKAECSSDKADVALMLDGDGNWQNSLYPSPGFVNSPEGYDLWQDTLSNSSALVISEVMTSNDIYAKQYSMAYCDWVELRNISNTPVQLSDYYLSDDDDCLQMLRLPAGILYPGEHKVIICDDSDAYPDAGYIKAPFKLSSDGEELYLSHAGSGLVDSVFLRDIPHNRSYGRLPGENGFFFLETPSPGLENGRGGRRVSAAPTALTEDGVFGRGGVLVELEGPGNIYYTTDGSLPTRSSHRYSEPFTVSTTCIVRAICIEDKLVPSRPLTLSYIIGQNHSMPVLSLVTDHPDHFWFIYNAKLKDYDSAGSLSLYEEDGSFTIPCGIQMHGEASLQMPKKSMSVKFSVAHGQETLSYDIYDGGVTEFSNLVLRAGLDINRNIPRNELLENLCLQFSENVPTQRGKHCVLYINGEYWGIYVLTEKTNEQHYANLMGVDKDSVIDNKVMISNNDAFYEEVIAFVKKTDISTKKGYEAFSRIMDIDNIIDWMIIQGYSGNDDITDSNIRFCRSSEGDGKWRIVLFDMDSTMKDPRYSFVNVLRMGGTPCSIFIEPLMKNDTFRDRFLTRTAEALDTVLSDENVVKELQRLKEIMLPEVERDFGRWGQSLSLWEHGMDLLCSDILEKQWSRTSALALCNYLYLSDSERNHYFGF